MSGAPVEARSVHLQMETDLRASGGSLVPDRLTYLSCRLRLKNSWMLWVAAATFLHQRAQQTQAVKVGSPHIGCLLTWVHLQRKRGCR